MKTTIACSTLFIALSIMIGCGKEEIKKEAQTANGGQIPPPVTGHGRTCYHYEVGAHWTPSGYVSGTTYLYGTGCGAGFGYVASKSHYLTTTMTDSTPAAGAPDFVQNMRVDIRSGSIFIATIYSDSNGDLDFSDFAAGEYTMTFSYSGYKTETYRITLPIASPGELFVLAKQ